VARSLEEATAAALLRLGASTLHEAVGGIGALDVALRPVWRGAAVCGPAYPVECHIGDNLPIHRALERVQSGDVLVVQAAGHVAGYFGEVLAVAAAARGVTGLVIDGGVRDVDRLEELRFPVFARGVGMSGTVKHSPGRTGEPVVVAGVSVAAGDVVVADTDGVLVLPANRVADALERGEARAAKERDVVERLRAGELTLDLLGLRATPKG
jgi:4-hydroxy-4-methyl-2-oxoglutarate aldolase